MQLKVLKTGISTGGPVIALIHEDDAHFYDLHHEDRIRIRNRNRSVVALVDITGSSHTLPRGRIGLFEEAMCELGACSGKLVDVCLDEKPRSLQSIRKKLEGSRLNYKEFYDIVSDIVHHRLDDIETTFFVAACFTRGLSTLEVIDLTKALVNTGERLKFGRKRVYDLHCIGGVPGNRTTIIAVPIIAAAGLMIPKTSSRAITSPAGTADTMEVLANVEIPIARLRRIVETVGGCIVWGGAINLAPADDKIIRIEHPLSIDAEGQLLASVLAKKFSVGATDVLIDIPIGKLVKARDIKGANRFKRMFQTVGRKLGMNIIIMFSEGNKPIGRGIGPALEARDCLWVLKNDSRGPKDLRQKSLEMAALLLEAGGRAKKGKGFAMAEEIITSGRAYKKMLEIISAQGMRETEPDSIVLGKHILTVKANRSGKIAQINNLDVAKIARIAGAPKDKEAGLYIDVQLNETVKKGQLLYTVYCSNADKLNYVRNYVRECTGFDIR